MKTIKLSKKVWLYILIAELILTGMLALFYSRKENTELNFTQDDLTYESGESGFYLDISTAGSYITTPDFSLPAGLYTVEVEYERSVLHAALLEILYSDGRYAPIISGRIALPDASRVSCDFRIKYDDRPIQLHGRLTGDAWENDYLMIRNIKIITSPYQMRNVLFQITAFFLFVDILLFLWSKKERFLSGADTGKHAKILLLLIAFNSIPLMVNYLLPGLDLPFHLTRLEGLKAGLESGMFPVKIQPDWLSGHGYPVSVFYGDLFLYPFALLRMFGISIQAVYRFYILCVNAATVLISYYCFSGMGNKNTGLVCTALYSLNIFRLECIYDIAAVGAYTAMIFFPLAAYGLWKIYTLPEESKEHGRSWITLALGCSGIFLSHIITTELAAFFIILVCIILWKKTFRKKILFALTKAAAMTACLSLWFLVPLLDFMLNGNYAIENNYAPYRIEDRSVFLSQLFMIDYNVSVGSFDSVQGAVQEMPLTVGLASLLVPVAWFYLCAGRGRTGKEKKEEYFTVFLILLSIFMTTAFFPYTWLAVRLPVLQQIVSSIQYPWRIFAITGLLCAYLLCLILKKEWIKPSSKKMLSGILIGIALLQSLSYMSKCLNELAPNYIYQSGNISGFDVSNGEYLPCNGGIKAAPEACIDQLTYEPEGIQVDDWHRENYAVIVTLANLTSETKQVEVPLLLYKGYHAVTDSGEQLAISPGESSRISVSVPAGFTGSFRVAFQEPWYWRVCELISLFSLAGLIVWLKIEHYHERKYGRQSEKQSEKQEENA